MFGYGIAALLLASPTPSTAIDRTPEGTSRPAPSNMPVPALRTLPAGTPTKRFQATLRPMVCNDIPGADALLRKPDLRWIVIGEMHGTRETPEIFADLVCLASASQPVLVAVEQATPYQSAIDNFIGSDGDVVARSRFLASGLWTQSMKDGRSSEAYFGLFQRLRALRAAGRITGVVAFQPSYSPGPAGFDAGDYENALAASLLGRARGSARVLVLVGNVHAMRTSPPWASPAYLPMAGYLPAGTSISLDARLNGGSYWACPFSAGCGPQTAPPSATKPARGMTPDIPGGPYAGALNLGVDVTASPPQKPLS